VKLNWGPTFSPLTFFVNLKKNVKSPRPPVYHPFEPILLGTRSLQRHRQYALDSPVPPVSLLLVLLFIINIL